MQDPRSYFQVGKHSQAKSEGHAAASDTLDGMQGLVNQLLGLREGPLEAGMSGATALGVLTEASQVAPQQNGSNALPASQLGQSLLVRFTYVPTSLAFRMCSMAPLKCLQALGVGTLELRASV